MVMKCFELWVASAVTGKHPSYIFLRDSEIFKSSKVFFHNFFVCR